MHLHQLAHSLRRLLTRNLLIVAMLLGLLLAACGGSSNNEPTANESMAAAATDTPAAATLVEATIAPTSIPTSGPTAVATAEAAQVPSESQSFQIDPEQSEARFIVDEVLFGNPNTVTGSTNEVSGELVINVADPKQSTVGEITINARTLATDNRFRNRSVNRLILQTNRDEYQFITFTPTAIEGLPATAAVGDTFSFQITGDLKIRDIIQPAIFDVTVTADRATQISGLAQTIVQRADFDLNIPDVDGVADVTEEVRLELEFVATASE
jgi:polyisoprenoid-binding protein YceI